jgi:hypothetical protein
VSDQGKEENDDDDDDEDGVPGTQYMDPVHVPCALPGYGTTEKTASLTFGHGGDTIANLVIEGPHRFALGQIQAELGGASTEHHTIVAAASLATRYNDADTNNDVLKVGPGAAFKGTCPDF